jgi:hypothetical protein
MILVIRILNFGFVSDFDIRISNFPSYCTRSITATSHNPHGESPASFSASE